MYFIYTAYVLFSFILINKKVLIVTFIATLKNITSPVSIIKSTHFFLVSFNLGAVNVLLMTPMWVVHTRLKLQGAKFRNQALIRPTISAYLVRTTHTLIYFTTYKIQTNVQSNHLVLKHISTQQRSRQSTIPLKDHPP